MDDKQICSVHPVYYAIVPAWLCAVALCRDIFCAGRVVEEDLQRTLKACGGAIQTSVNGLIDSVLGTCEAFQEEQIGGDRYDRVCLDVRHSQQIHSQMSIIVCVPQLLKYNARPIITILTDFVYIDLMQWPTTLPENLTKLINLFWVFF